MHSARDVVGLLWDSSKEQTSGGQGKASIWAGGKECLEGELKRNENVLDCQRLIIKDLRDKMKEAGIIEYSENEGLGTEVAEKTEGVGGVGGKLNKKRKRVARKEFDMQGFLDRAKRFCGA